MYINQGVAMLDPVSIYTVLTAFIPTASYGIKKIIDYNTGGNKQIDTQAYTAQREADAKVLEIINRTPDNVSTWVANVIALQRPIAVLAILLNWTLVTIVGLMGGKVDLQLYVITANLASCAVFYLFGQSILMYSLEGANRKLLGQKGTHE